MQITNNFSLSVVIRVDLIVQSAEEYVLEPDCGEFATVYVCFSASVQEPLDSAAVFEFVASDLTTATTNVDFVIQLSSPFLTIPSGFAGQYVECVHIVIIGDNEVEEDERIVFGLVPLSEQDRVTFPPEATELVINILNNDGKI